MPNADLGAGTWRARGGARADEPSDEPNSRKSGQGGAVVHGPVRDDGWDLRNDAR